MTVATIWGCRRLQYRHTELDKVVESLLKLARATSFDSLSREAIGGAKRMVLDAVGCAIGASQEPTARIVADIADEVSTQRPCTVFCRSAATTSAELAAFANGVLVRYLDFNDTYVSASRVGHPSDYIPSVLAASEENGADGRTILAAVSLVYETYCGLMDGVALSGAHFDNVVYGSVASALGAGYVWGLSDAELANAVGLALVPNIALRATRFGVVSDWKGLASGNACRNGLWAARIASRGITGPSEPFMGIGGLCASTGSEVDWNRLHRRSRLPAVLESHLKQYPAGFFAQTAIDAADEIRLQLPPASTIHSVEVRTCDEALRMMANDSSKWRPDTRETADHSLPFLVAFTLVRGRITKEAFSHEAIHDEALLAIVRDVRVVADEACNREWPGAALTKMTVVLSDRTEFTADVRFHHGHARNPLTGEELHAKFMSQAEPAIGRLAAEAVADAIHRLDTSDVTALMRRVRYVQSN